MAIFFSLFVLRKFRALVEGTPPKMKDALLAQDFSNVTADDMRRLNITVIEYLPVTCGADS